MMLTWVFTFPGCGLISFVMAKYKETSKGGLAVNVVEC